MKLNRKRILIFSSTTSIIRDKCSRIETSETKFKILMRNLFCKRKTKLFYKTIMLLTFSLNCFAEEPSVAPSNIGSPSSKEPARRAKPAPFDAIFPSTEYLGPTIGVPNTDPIFPLTKILWKDFPKLEENNIRIYGWVNPSFNISSSKNSNAPLTYTIVPNHLELDQLVIRLERVPDTVQTNQMDWGFRLSNIYGMDYRYTTAQGYFSHQLLADNNLYGYDPVEAYWQLYVPSVAQGMVVTVGRYISPPDIEAQLSPQNYLVTHSLMFTFDTYTQTGVNAALKLNDTWSIQFGLHSGNDVAPWTNAASIPTPMAFVRWISPDNNDSLWGGMDSLNGGKFKGNHTNLQQFNLTWSHRFTENFFTETEVYYIYQHNAASGGTCNFGPIKPFGGGGGCGATLLGYSDSIGAVNYIEYKIQDKNFMSFRTDFFNDPRGQLSGFSSSYMSWTLGLTHFFTPYFEIRPEVRYETAFQAIPYDNGTKKNQSIFIIDAILRF